MARTRHELKETAYLFFHEGNQRFTIIPNGVTITEAYDGKSILASSVEELRGIVKGLEFAAHKFGLAYTQDMFEQMPIGAIYVAEKKD